MNPEIEELKELVRQNIALTQDNNKLLHSIRRGEWFSRTMRMLWILLLVGASVYSYFYLQPYLAQITEFYSNLQGLQQQASGFFNQPQGQ